MTRIYITENLIELNWLKRVWRNERRVSISPTILCKKIELSSYIHFVEYVYRMVRSGTFFFVFVFSFIPFIVTPNALYHYQTNKLALFRGNGKFNKFKLKIQVTWRKKKKYWIFFHFLFLWWTFLGSMYTFS